MAIEDDGAAGAAGGAADLLGGAATDAIAAGGAGGGEDTAAAAAAAAAAGAADVDGAADPDWWGTLSAEADGETASHRDYIKAKGFKTFDDVVKAYRGAEKAIHDTGRVKIPGEGAKPEEIAAFHKAIGVPDDPNGYAIAAPKDEAGNEIPLDTDLIGRLAEVAHKHGAPKAVFEGLVGDFVKIQLDQAAEFDAQHQAEAAALVKSWGAGGKEKLAAVDRAASALGFTRDDMVAIRNALGSEKALNTFVKLGEGMAEDVLISGGRGKFGVSGAEAVAEIAKLKTDKEFQSKLMAGDSASVARWDRLNDAQAAYEEAQRAAA